MAHPLDVVSPAYISDSNVDALNSSIYFLGTPPQFGRHEVIALNSELSTAGRSARSGRCPGDALQQAIIGKTYEIKGF
jgi:hypothetical protein